MNSKKGFVIPFIITIVAILAIGGVVFVTQKKEVKAPVIIDPMATTNETKDWKKYTNSELGFEFNYPVNWIITSNFPLLIISSENYKMLENFRLGKESHPVNSFNVKIDLDAGCFESSGTKEVFVFNGIPAEQFTQEDEAGMVKFICINNLNNTYRIEGLTGDTEKKILSTFKFISTTTSPIACTMDAMMCPDGTYVGRTGPKCEFVCLITISIKNKLIGTELKYYDLGRGELIYKIKEENIQSIETAQCGYADYKVLESECYRVSIGNPAGDRSAMWYIYFDKDTLEQVKKEQLFRT